MYGCARVHQYVYDIEIHVESDHKPFGGIFPVPPRLQRMLLKLQRYSLKVIYKPEKEMHMQMHWAMHTLMNRLKTYVLKSWKSTGSHVSCHIWGKAEQNQKCSSWNTNATYSNQERPAQRKKCSSQRDPGILDIQGRNKLHIRVAVHSPEVQSRIQQTGSFSTSLWAQATTKQMAKLREQFRWLKSHSRRHSVVRLRDPYIGLLVCRITTWGPSFPPCTASDGTLQTSSFQHSPNPWNNI